MYKSKKGKHYYKITLYLLFTLLGITHSVAQQLVINEFMSQNISSFEDLLGDTPDWIEIYNPSTVSIDMSKCFLSDEPDNLGKWQFPEKNILPGEFLLVFASGRDTMYEMEIHTNFKIESSGEKLLLSDISGNILDELDEIDLEKNISFGRLPDGSNNLEVFYTSSPGISNIHNTPQNELDVSHPAGFYTEAISLEILPSVTSDIIYYTLDGSIPTIHSSIYSNPIQLNSRKNDELVISNIPTTPLSGPNPLSELIWHPPTKTNFLINSIRYRAYNGLNVSSKIYSQSYIINNSANNRFEFPVISLISEKDNFFNYDTGIYVPGARFGDNGWDWWPDGNYMNEGIDWERDVHVEFFEKDGSLGFSQDCGMRIYGGWSASQAQKSLRLIARDKYLDDAFDYEIFPESGIQAYKNIVLRNSGNDFIATHFRDALLQSLLSDLDLELQGFRPSVVYMNGEYWGIHNIREKYNEQYFNRHFDINEEDLILVNVCGIPEIGINHEYVELVSFVRNNSLEVPDNYEFVKSKIDILNFVDYHIAQIFLGNSDWPCNNNRAWKTTDADSKWRWLVFDLDYGFGLDLHDQYNFNNLNEILDVDGPHCSCSTELLQSLLKNTTFKELFLSRYEYLLNHTFQTDTVLLKINTFTRLFENEILYHIDRWHYPQSKLYWENEVNYLKEFAMYRPCYSRNHVIDEFELTEFDFTCDNSYPIIDSSNIQIIIYPNPNNGIFFLERTDPYPDDAELVITDLLGIRIETSKIYIRRNKITPIDISYLPKGMYFAILKNSKCQVSEKVIIR